MTAAASHPRARTWRLSDLPAPEPVPDMDAYLANRARALADDPVRRANFEAYSRAGRRTTEPGYLPIKLDIENVSRCNLACTMCPVGTWPNRRRAADMRLDAFKRLIDEQAGLVEIKLQGIGEPTLQSDAFFEMIRYARARHIWVRTTTNATLLHLKDNARKLVDSGVNEIQVSIDAADPETYESIRRGADFARVTKNARMLNDHCDARGKVLAKMWTVVQRANRDRLADLVRLAADLGFERQVFSLELSDWALDGMRERNRAAAASDVDAGELMELVELGRSRGVRVAFWSVHEKYDSSTPEHLCPWPFERAVVASDGRVVPCCYVGNPDVFAIADEPIASFTDVWRGEAMRAFRKSHLDGAPPAICRACYKAN